MGTAQVASGEKPPAKRQSAKSREALGPYFLDICVFRPAKSIVFGNGGPERDCTRLAGGAQSIRTRRALVLAGSEGRRLARLLSRAAQLGHQVLDMMDEVREELVQQKKPSA